MNILKHAHVSRLYETLKHLRLSQILYRLKYRLDFWSAPSSLKNQTISPNWDANFDHLKEYQLAHPPSFQKSNLVKGEYEFIHIKEQINYPPNWDFRSPHKLWRYQLHYFDWLFCLDYQDAKKCVLNWIELYSFKKSRDGWEAYPTSLRLINWCIYFGAIHRIDLKNDSSFCRTLCKTIQIQTSWLERRLEYHLGVNHLFENAAALAIIGCIFLGKDANRWRNRGLNLLNHEITEQILPDGMHCERSPMYHLRMFHVLNNVHLCFAAIGENKWENVILSMQKALNNILHPDEDIALFNDSNFGVYPLQNKKYLPKKIIEGSWQLPSAGYFGYRGSNGEYIIVDAGAIGPDFNPGHAHGDIFSYELSWQNRRIIVDSGNFDYESSDMRTYCRSTKAHNTVELDDKDQSDFWGTFRVGKRASPKELNFKDSNNGFHLDGFHNGYRDHWGNAIHRRSIDYHTSQGLQITDSIESNKIVKAISRIHFHPDCQIINFNNQHLLITNCDVNCKIRWDLKSEAILEDFFYCPKFNTKYTSKSLALIQHGLNFKIQYKVSFSMA
jgi:uncharacterized heparinase superfamily protein